MESNKHSQEQLPQPNKEELASKILLDKELYKDSLIQIDLVSLPVNMTVEEAIQSIKNKEGIVPFKIIERNTNKYNDIPVHYCTECLSLKVRIYNEDMDYCDECGSTDINETSITEWSELFKNKYKQDFLTYKKKKI